MTGAMRTVLEQALLLGPVERAELITELLHSFDAAPDARIDAAWAEEAEARLRAYRAGKIAADSAENVFARINRR